MQAPGTLGERLMSKVLVLIPCYNEQESILKTFYELKQLKPELDVLVINDCSMDDSLDILVKNNVPHISLPINLGIGGAIQAGYRYAYKHGYDIALQMDGDGQHDPAWIDSLTRPIIDGEADLVIGSRFLEKKGYQSSRFRRMGISFFSLLLLCLTRKRITDATSGFRAAGRSVIRLFANEYAKDYPEPESNMLALKNGFRVTEVPVEMRKRQGGLSSINSFIPLYYMIKVSVAILLHAIAPTKKYKE